ncbi:hypothetical protein DVA67_016790 [Solirubrobacter sp. CPCC 204708]|uniref:DUF5996 family protein n=1 Tax=Solirubrobacter deserti TaxID=2282478 RepID=A0ABT4RJR6_9ACTN|nr:DUF5996 family protein [Solirubrobacter deserti]MBE2317641.1 hypothetical protein [Solirubrobacter deserti]MDA0138591.1 DUF5996 family protein [Solirubrobacter deserti]
MSGSTAGWPALRVDEWTETRETLHMWLQIVGKLRMAGAPMVNHWWQVTLYVTPRGLTTGAIPAGAGTCELTFDFHDDQLRIDASSGARATVALEPKTVARFYAEVMDALKRLELPLAITATPNEVNPAIPFAEDEQHSAYDPDAVHTFWRQLVQADRVLQRFRSRYLGKVSPVHFFWGAMDLACTRFTGRSAPKHPGGAPNCGDWVMVEGYSHELSSCGFWPGGGEEGAFYAYAYPEPDGFKAHEVLPEQAYYFEDGGQYLLPYEAVRSADDPEATLLDFLQTTYEAAAVHGGWNRAELEYEPVPGARP